MNRTTTRQNRDYSYKDGERKFKGYESSIREKEFEKALKAAKKKAEIMAKSLGARVGSVENIIEINTGNLNEEFRYSNEVVPLNASDVYGSIEISAVVDVDFRLIN